MQAQTVPRVLIALWTSLAWGFTPLDGTVLLILQPNTPRQI